MVHFSIECPPLNHSLVARLQPTQRLGGVRGLPPLVRLILPGQQLGHFPLAILVLLFELIRNFRIRESQREDLLLQLAVGEVEAAPHPAPVRAGVGLELDARVEGVVRDDLHRLLLSHEKSQPLVLAMAEDARVADAALLPGFDAGALVEEGLAVEEEFRAVGAEGLLLLLAGFDLDFF